MVNLKENCPQLQITWHKRLKSKPYRASFVPEPFGDIGINGYEHYPCFHPHRN